MIILWNLSIMIICITYNISLLSSDLIVQSNANAKIPLLIQPIGKEPISSEIITTLKKDMEFSKQCSAFLVQYKTRIERHDMHAWNKQGIGLAILIEQRNNRIHYALYDTNQLKVLVQKTASIKDSSMPLRWYAHNIADEIWPLLTGEKGCFSSKLAYCKDILKDGKMYKHIFCADYDGSHEKLIVSGPTLYIAPSWNIDVTNPLLLFSEYTNKNIALMALDVHGNKRLVSNFDGLNMQLSFSPDGKRVVYCASRGQGNADIYYYDPQTFQRLTSNYATNISPTFGNQGSCVYYCSDEHGTPKIYCRQLKDESIEAITREYSICPVFHQHKRRLAYIKRSGRILQIWTYDPCTGLHQCITDTPGDKDECCWSDCGNYLLYTVRRNGKSLLAQYSLITQCESIVTGRKENISFPSWSRCYRKPF